MPFFKDVNCDSALTALENALCELELVKGEKYIVVIIPENPDEEIYLSQNGKPSLGGSVDLKVFLPRMIEERDGRWKKSLLKSLDDAIGESLESVREAPIADVSKKVVDKGIRKRVEKAIEGTE
jgi:hypothetical protein